MRSYTWLPVLVLILVQACGSNPQGAKTVGGDGGRGSAAADADVEKVGDFTPPKEEIPAAVREIEDMIEHPSIILASDAEIYVSKNYQFEVGLAGEDVTPDLDKSGINERIARGNAIATVRNLQIRCDEKIRVRIADFGTQPFIRVAARGHCSHLVTAQAGVANDVKRSDAIVIDDDQIRYLSGPASLGLPAATPAATKSR